MKQIIAMLLALGFGTAATADPIEDVIVNQLEAFNARDADSAFAFASPMIKRLFGTSENFLAWLNAGIQWFGTMTLCVSLTVRIIPVASFSGC